MNYEQTKAKQNELNAIIFTKEIVSSKTVCTS